MEKQSFIEKLKAHKSDFLFLAAIIGAMGIWVFVAIQCNPFSSPQNPCFRCGWVVNNITGDKIKIDGKIYTVCYKCKDDVRAETIKRFEMPPDERTKRILHLMIEEMRKEANFDTAPKTITIHEVIREKVLTK